MLSFINSLRPIQIFFLIDVYNYKVTSDGKLIFYFCKIKFKWKLKNKYIYINFRRNLYVIPYFFNI